MLDGARQLSTLQVSRGDTLDFIVTADQNGATSGNYYGDTTELDVNLQQGTGSTIPKPVVSGVAVISKSSTDATIQASINPEGHATTWRVEYASTAGGPWTAVPSPNPLDPSSDPSQTSPVTVTLRIPCPVGGTGCTAALQSGHTYYFRVVAINAGGTTTTSPPGKFDIPSPPEVHTTPPCTKPSCAGGPDIELDSINMHGTVNPNGAPATWQFQITPCAGFDYSHCPSSLKWTKSFPSAPQSLAADGALHPVTAQATGLTPGVTYYWRLVASNTVAPTPWQLINASIQHAMPGDVTAPTIAVTATNLAGSGTATLKPGALVALDYATNATIAYSCTDPTGPNGVRPSGLSQCEATDNGQALTSGHALPTTTTGSHALQVTATDFAHNTTTQSWTYTVKAKPTPAQQTKSAQQTQRQIVKQWTPSLWDQWFTPHHTYCVVSTNCGSSANPGLTVWQTGAVTTAPSGTIISAGSDNLYNKGSSEPLLQSTQHLYEALDSRGRLYAVIGAGGGNIIGAGGGNIIAAGGGNITPNVAVVGIIAAGGGNIVSAGGGNIIAAGGDNIISAGGGNIIAAGGGNIIAAGGGNFGAGLMFALNGSGSAFYNNFDVTKLAPSPSLNPGTLMQTVSGTAGDTLVSTINLDGSTITPSADAYAGVASAGGTKFASGQVTFQRTGQPTFLSLKLTTRATGLIKKLVILNHKLRKHHKGLRSITLTVSNTFKPLGGKPFTKRSTVKLTPR